MIFALLDGVGASEILVILVVVLVFFGADKLPGLARSLGQGIRQFQDATNEIRTEIERAGEARPASPPVATPPVPPAPVSAPPVVPTAPPSASGE